MEQPGGVHRRYRVAEVDPQRNSLSRGEAFACSDDLLERAPGDQLHPQSDPVIDDVGAVNGDHVGVADASQEAALFDDGGAALDEGISRRNSSEQLERDFTIEPLVPRAIDLAEGAAAEPLDQPQMPPALRRNDGRPRALRFCDGLRWTAMELDDGRESFQATEHWTIRIAAARFGRRPVDGGAVQDGGGELGVEPFTPHCSSPWPVAPARARPPCAPLRHWASRAPPPSPRRSSPSRRAR